jgi:hypothetical protein
MGRQKLGTWFEEHRLWRMPVAEVRKKVTHALETELARAKAAGWEV